MANVVILQNLIKLPSMAAREDLQRLPKYCATRLRVFFKPSLRHCILSASPMVLECTVGLNLVTLTGSQVLVQGFTATGILVRTHGKWISQNEMEHLNRTTPDR